MRPLSWDQPYPSSRSPVMAENMVATSQPLATSAGLRALSAGGNAVDAALASAITLTVVEPCSNGIGSDAFAILWDGKQLHGLNASGRAPAAWNPERFAGLDTMPALGWDTVTVPGAVSAWVALSERFGKLPFRKLFDDAIHYARKGYLLGPRTGAHWANAATRLNHMPDFMRTFCPGGKAPVPGERVRLPDHANSLERIRDSFGADFYTGELAATMVRDAANNGGALSAEDLANHHVNWVGTLSQSFYGTELHEIPPSGQGLGALIALGICQHLELDTLAVDDVDCVHRQIEAFRIAWADIERNLADIDSMHIRPEDMLAPDYLKRRAAEIDLNQANLSPTALGASPDTVYLTTADASGMMVSMIQSNYRGFGSGIIPEGTGISLQNRGCGFTLEAGHPNQVGGGKRPFHTIIPGFVTANGKPLMSFGVMGGHMQAQGHLQMMVRIALHGQNPQAAADAPRWQLMEDGTVILEEGFDPGVADALAARGHRIKTDQPGTRYGGAQLIYRLNEGYCGASEPRLEGQASGF